eukprot:SM000130S27085  [mRNA]  locus=s130:647:6984:- [translate_table: standard]
MQYLTRVGSASDLAQQPPSTGSTNNGEPFPLAAAMDSRVGAGGAQASHSEGGGARSGGTTGSGGRARMPIEGHRVVGLDEGGVILPQGDGPPLLNNLHIPRRSNNDLLRPASRSEFSMKVEILDCTYFMEIPRLLPQSSAVVIWPVAATAADVILCLATGPLPDLVASRAPAEVAAIVPRARDFVFAGEQLRIVVYLSPAKQQQSTGAAAKSPEHTLVRKTSSTVYLENSPQVLERRDMASRSQALIRDEAVTEASRAALASAARSVFHVRLTSPDGYSSTRVGWKSPRESGSGFATAAAAAIAAEGREAPTVAAAAAASVSPGGGALGSVRTALQHGCTPLVAEGPAAEHGAAGGLARAAAVSALPNGDVVIVLQVVVASSFAGSDAVLEVLQYERSDGGGDSVDESLADLNLLRWLLPLEVASTALPLDTAAAAAASAGRASPPPASLPTSSSTPSFSSLAGFSFSSTSSAPSPPRPTAAAAAAGLAASLRLPTGSKSSSTSGTVSPPPYLDDELGGRALYTPDGVGNEGLLSFRGHTLDPQRFAAQWGLDGLHTPGRKWMRHVAVLMPVTVESFAAECDTSDLICVLVENVLPASGNGAGSGVTLYIDAVSLECEGEWPAAAGPLVSLEVGEPHRLPDLPLRPGEQHSFVLRSNLKRQPADWLDLRGLQSAQGERAGARAGVKEPRFSVLLSCRSSHSESRLLFRHHLSWSPRPRRDVLLSVSQELPASRSSTAASTSQMSSLSHQFIKAQALSVHATNLTSEELHLTLLAPVSLAATALGRLTFPTSPLHGGPPPRTGSAPAPLFPHREALHADSPLLGSGERRAHNRSSSSQGPLLPPVRRMESLLGAAAVAVSQRQASLGAAAASTAADAPSVAEPSPRSHLWLQSVAPMGKVPPHSTTTICCELLPLVDGIITLDTLHVSTKQRDVLFIPEKPLQIYAVMNGDELSDGDEEDGLS